MAAMAPSASPLDALAALSAPVEAQRVDAAVILMQHLIGSQRDSKDEMSKELTYTLERLIRSIGTSRLNSRTGFFSTLVLLFSSFPIVTVSKILGIVEKELHISGNASKTEQSETFTGRILAGGALIRSERLLKVDSEEVHAVLKLMIEAGKKKSYLPLVCLSFILDFMGKVDADGFKSLLWPVLKAELEKPWEEHTLETLNILLVASNSFPGVVKSKFLRKTLGTESVLAEEAIIPCVELLMNAPMVQILQHPVYEEFCKQLAMSDILIPFWENGVDPKLVNGTRIKVLTALTMLESIFKYLSDKSKIPKLLTPHLLASIRNNSGSQDTGNMVSTMGHEVFTQLVALLKDDMVTDKTRLSVFKKLIFHYGNFTMDRITGVRVIHAVISKLSIDGVKKLSAIYRDVIIGITPKPSDQSENAVVWNNSERLYAAQMFAKLLGLPAVLQELEWKVEQLKFLIKNSWLTTSPNPIEGAIPVRPALAKSIKECFFRALDQNFPRLQMLCSLLSAVVHYIHELLFANGQPYMLHQPLSEQSKVAWCSMMEVISELEASQADKEDQESAVPLFHAMFLHMGLQLFQDATLAEEALQELHNCYVRLCGKVGNKDDDDSEPHWVEVAVDLILSLLSHSSHLLRSLVGSVFPHLCPHLTPSALQQIVHVLDPNTDQSPLCKERTDTQKDDASMEQSEESDYNEDDNGDEKMEVDEANGDYAQSSDDDDSTNNEPVNAQLRQAVREALGQAANTDEESVDMDKMDEEEATRLNTALSEAFKLLKTSRVDNRKSKKQSREDRILTHFRVRVIDLLDMYLGAQPSLIICLDLMLPLFDLLVFCIKDVHQKPLENRVRVCMNKLSNVKRFSDMDGIDQRMLGEVLGELLERGQHVASVLQDMGQQVTAYCSFLIRCSQRLLQAASPSKKKKKKANLVVEKYKEAVAAFFEKRNCMLPFTMFKSALQISWDGAWDVAAYIVDFAFDTQIRPYRRSQALNLLKVFFSNQNVVANEINKERAEALEEKLCQASIGLLSMLTKTEPDADDEQTHRPQLRSKFVQELYGLLLFIAQKKRSELGAHWSALGGAMVECRQSGKAKTYTKWMFVKLARVLGVK